MSLSAVKSIEDVKCRMRTIWQKLTKMNMLSISFSDFVDRCEFFYPCGDIGGIAFTSLVSVNSIWAINAYAPKSMPDLETSEKIFQVCSRLGCTKFISNTSCNHVRRQFEKLGFKPMEDFEGWYEREA